MGDVSSVESQKNKSELISEQRRVVIFANQARAEPYKKVLSTQTIQVEGIHLDIATNNLTALTQLLNSPVPGNVPDIVITEYDPKALEPNWWTMVKRIKKLGQEAQYKDTKPVNLFILTDYLADEVDKTLIQKIESIPDYIKVLSKSDFFINPLDTIQTKLVKTASNTPI